MDQPISAPPVAPEDKWEEDAPYNISVQAKSPPPPVREMMRVSNRFNYSQYYLVPARVGVRMLSEIMDEMFREGCSLVDIQVTFEVQEVGRA